MNRDEWLVDAMRSNSTAIIQHFQDDISKISSIINKEDGSFKELELSKSTFSRIFEILESVIDDPLALSNLRKSQKRIRRRGSSESSSILSLQGSKIKLQQRESGSLPTTTVPSRRSSGIEKSSIPSKKLNIKKSASAYSISELSKHKKHSNSQSVGAEIKFSQEPLGPAGAQSVDAEIKFSRKPLGPVSAHSVDAELPGPLVPASAQSISSEVQLSSEPWEPAGAQSVSSEVQLSPEPLGPVGAQSVSSCVNLKSFYGSAGDTEQYSSENLSLAYSKTEVEASAFPPLLGQNQNRLAELEFATENQDLETITNTRVDQYFHDPNESIELNDEELLQSIQEVVVNYEKQDKIAKGKCLVQCQDKLKKLSHFYKSQQAVDVQDSLSAKPEEEAIEKMNAEIEKLKSKLAQKEKDCHTLHCQLVEQKLSEKDDKERLSEKEVIRQSIELLQTLCKSLFSCSEEADKILQIVKTMKPKRPWSI